MFRAPGRFDFIPRDNTGIVGSRENCGAEYGPRNGSANENEYDGDDSLGHVSTPCLSGLSWHTATHDETLSLPGEEQAMWSSTESVCAELRFRYFASA